MKMPPLLKEPSSLSARRQLLGWKASVNLLRARSLHLGMAALAGSSLLFAGALRAANTELDVASGLASGSDLSVGTSYTGGTAPTAASDVTFNATNTYASPYVFNSSTAIGTLNDLSATAISITGGAGTPILSGGGDSVPGSSAGDLVFVGNGSNLTYTQGITLGLTGNFDVAGTGTATFTGNIGDGGNENAVNPDPVHNFSLIKTGTGNLILSKNNTFTGGTVVNAGTLTSNNGGPYSTFRGTVTVNAGGTLALNATDSFGYNSPGNATDQIVINGGTVNDLVNGNQGYLASLTMTGGTLSSTGGGSYNFNTGTTITTNASATTALISAPVTIRSGNNLAVTVASGTTASGSDLTISGAIGQNGGTGALTKNGAGTMLLTATNTYGGTTTVNAGRLLVSGGGLAGGAVTVTGTGTTFGGSGAVGGTVNVGNGSILTVRTGTGTTSGVGALNTGALTLGTGSTFNAFLASNTSVSTLSAAGTTALGGAAFTISLATGATFTNGQILELISSAVSGTFTNATYTTGGYTFTADYTNAPDPGAFAVDVTAAPEPSTWAALVSLAGMAGFAYRRRTRA